jgi:hypothetical protein
MPVLQRRSTRRLPAKLHKTADDQTTGRRINQRDGRISFLGVAVHRKGLEQARGTVPGSSWVAIAWQLKGVTEIRSTATVHPTVLSGAVVMDMAAPPSPNLSTINEKSGLVARRLRFQSSSTALACVV